MRRRQPTNLIDVHANNTHPGSGSGTSENRNCPPLNDAVGIPANEPANAISELMSLTPPGSVTMVNVTAM
jgi:hypothetical protein